MRLPGDIKKVEVQTECLLSPLAISNLPYKQATITEATLRAPAIRLISGCRPRTPLFIGFSENEPLLEQAVLSYIACGWPSIDIIIVDSTAALENNIINYDKFRRLYGVNILQTPGQLSFSQLQNFYIYTAKLQGWEYFFWTHMDIVVLNYPYPAPSLYQNVLSSLKNITAAKGADRYWAFGWYHYDYLSLVNVLAATIIGQWDIDIPYYHSDCDYYSRSRIYGFQIFDFDVGYMIDVDSILPNMQWQLLNGSHNSVLHNLRELGKEKKRNREIQPFWQEWGPAREIIVGAGRKVYKKKYGTDSCHLRIIPK
jgi:hypothetical protein